VTAALRRLQSQGVASARKAEIAACGVAQAERTDPRGACNALDRRARGDNFRL